MHIHLERKLEYKPFGWSFGYCPSCQSDTPTTREREFQAVGAGGRPLWRTLVASVERCDFCQRLIDTGADNNSDLVGIHEWSPSQGIPTLLNCLGIPPPYPIVDFNAPTRLRSLLTAAQDFPTRRVINTIGLILGAIFGFFASVVCFCPFNHFSAELGTIGGLPTIMFIGALVGSVIGSLINFRIERNRSARKLIVRAYKQYNIDLHAVYLASAEYSNWLQKVAQSVQAKFLLR